MARQCSTSSSKGIAIQTDTFERRKLFIAKLDHRCSRREIGDALYEKGSEYGDVVDVFVPVPKKYIGSDWEACETHRGIAFVTFRTHKGAEAFQDTATFIGKRPIVKKWAKEKERFIGETDSRCSRERQRSTCSLEGAPPPPKGSVRSPPRSPSPETLSRRKLRYPRFPQVTKLRLFKKFTTKAGRDNLSRECARKVTNGASRCSPVSNGKYGRIFDENAKNRLNETKLHSDERRLKKIRTLNSEKGKKCAYSEEDSEASTNPNASHKDNMVHSNDHRKRGTDKGRLNPGETRLKRENLLISEKDAKCVNSEKDSHPIPNGYKQPSRDISMPSRSTLNTFKKSSVGSGSGSVEKLRGRKRPDISEQRSSHFFDSSIPRLQHAERNGRVSASKTNAIALESQKKPLGAKPPSVFTKLEKKMEVESSRALDSQKHGKLIGRKKKRKSMGLMEMPGPRKVHKTKEEPRCPRQALKQPARPLKKLSPPSRSVIGDCQTPTMGASKSLLHPSTFVPSSIFVQTPPPTATHYFRATYVQDGRPRTKSFASEARGHKNHDYLKEAIAFAEGRYKDDITAWHSILKYFDPEMKAAKSMRRQMKDTSIPEGFRKAKADARIFRRTLNKRNLTRADDKRRT